MSRRTDGLLLVIGLLLILAACQTQSEEQKAARQGEQALARNRPEKAVRHFSDALRVRPNDPYLRSQRAIAYLESGMPGISQYDLAEAENDACSGGTDKGECILFRESLVTRLNGSMARQGRTGIPLCDTYYLQAYNYEWLHKMTGQSEFRELANRARSMTDPISGDCEKGMVGLTPATNSVR